LGSGGSCFVSRLVSGWVFGLGPPGPRPKIFFQVFGGDDTLGDRVRNCLDEPVWNLADGGVPGVVCAVFDRLTLDVVNPKSRILGLADTLLNCVHRCRRLLVHVVVDERTLCEGECDRVLRTVALSVRLPQVPKHAADDVGCVGGRLGVIDKVGRAAVQALLEIVVRDPRGALVGDLVRELFGRRRGHAVQRLRLGLRDGTG
jgi:hypothetical protein